jgi:hypothetical protein
VVGALGRGRLGRERALRVGLREAAVLDRHERAEEHEPQQQEPRRAHVAERDRDQPEQAVRVQDVAGPLQTEAVQQAEHDQPQAPPQPHVDLAALPPAARRAFRQQHQAGAEQHREQRPHLAVEQAALDEPGPQVRALRAATTRRVVVGADRQAELDHVHDQDAEHGEPTDHVDGDMALLGGGRQRRGARQRRRDNGWRGFGRHGALLRKVARVGQNPGDAGPARPRFRSGAAVVAMPNTLWQGCLARTLAISDLHS